MATTTGLATDLITFSRASLGTVIANDGKIKWPSHNLLLASEQFDNAAWSRFNVQAFGSGSTANATTAPNGTTTADFIAETAIDNAHILYNTTNHTLDIGTKYTLGAFGKSGTRNHLSLSVNSAGGAGAGVVYDLNAGTVTQSGTTSAAYTIVSSSITSVGSGWYYCSMTFSSTQVTASTCLCISNSGTPTVQASTQRPTYLGDGTSGLYVWGAQLNRADLGGMLLNSSAYPYYNPTTTSAAFHAARLDYEPSTLSAKGLLIEEQRTNLITYSDQFDNTAWVKGYSSVTANAITDPSGNTTGDKLVEDSTASQTHTLLQYSSITSGVTYAYTVYAKAAERSVIILQLGTAGFSSSPSVWFDLSAGTVSKSTGTIVASSIQSVGNGWYRCSAIATATTTSATVPQRIYLDTSPTGTGVYTGNGSSGVYIWGAQLEAATFPSSYIPTVSSTVTRSAETAYVLTSSFPYSTTAGSVIVKAIAPNAASVNTTGYNPMPIAFQNATVTNRIYALRSSTNYLATIMEANVSQASSSGTWNNGATKNFAIAWSANDFAFVEDNGSVTIDTSGTVPTGIDKMSIGNINGGGQFNGWIQNITYIPRRLTNAELQGRTI